MHRLPRAGPRRQQDGGQRERPGRRAPPLVGHRQQQGAAALPARPAQPVRVLEQRRDPVRRRVRRRPEHQELRQGRAGRPDDLRRIDRRHDRDDRSRRRAGRPPRLVEEHGCAEHDRVHLRRSDGLDQRSAAGHRGDRLRAVRRRRLGGAADAGAVGAGEEPLLPGHRARRQSGRLRRIDLHRRTPTARAWRRTSRATPTPTRRRRCS